MKPDRQLQLDPDEKADLDRFNEKLRHWLRASRLRFVLIVAINLVALSVLSVLTVGVVRSSDLEHERERARDETCVLFERQAQSAVTRLSNTYRYLEDLSDKALRDDLNRAILRQVPSIEQDANDARAPGYCAPPDIGLRKPPPEIPERPAVLARLLPPQ